VGVCVVGVCERGNLFFDFFLIVWTVFSALFIGLPTPLKYFGRFTSVFCDVIRPFSANFFLSQKLDFSSRFFPHVLRPENGLTENGLKTARKKVGKSKNRTCDSNTRSSD
jgi:hypothetical protein